MKERKPGFVYLARSIENGETFYKIGCTTNLRQRLSQLRVEYNSDIRFICVIAVNDRFKWESYFRAHYWHGHIEGLRDWFHLDEDSVSYFLNQPVFLFHAPNQTDNGATFNGVLFGVTAFELSFAKSFLQRQSRGNG